MKNSIRIIKKKLIVLFIFANIITSYSIAESSEIDDSNEESCHCNSCSFDRQTNIKNYYKKEIQDSCLANDILRVYEKSVNSINHLKNMIKIKTGIFAIGTNNPIFIADGEGPKQQIYLNSFYIDKTEVSNRDFAKFVNVTKYKTEAERFGDSFVFGSLLKQKSQENVTLVVAQVPWWLQVKNANWLHPEGPESDIKSMIHLFDCLLPNWK